MYSIAEVTAHIDQNLAWVMFWTVIAWVAGFVQIVEAIRLTRRDKVPGMPMGMTVFLMAHDSTYCLRYEHWLNTVNHWYFTVFLVGMGVSVLIELYMLVAYCRYTRPQLTPQLSPGAFVALLLVFQASAYAMLWWLQSLMDDPLYLVALASTQIAAVVFNIPMLLVRGNAQGQSRLFAWATLLGPGSLALGLFPALSPVFQTPQFAGVCAGMLALSVAYVLLLERYRRCPLRP